MSLDIYWNTGSSQMTSGWAVHVRLACNCGREGGLRKALHHHCRRLHHFLREPRRARVSLLHHSTSVYHSTTNLNHVVDESGQNPAKIATWQPRVSLHQHPRPLHQRVALDQQPPWIQDSWLLPGDFKCRPGGFDTTLSSNFDLDIFKLSGQNWVNQGKSNSSS